MDRLVGKQVLDDELRFAVRAYRPQGMIFRERQALGLAIDRCARAEHQPRHLERCHRLEQRHGAADIVVVIEKRLFDRLADRLQAGEMQHRIDASSHEHFFQTAAVAQVGAMELDRAARQLAQPLQNRWLGAREVIDDAEAVAPCGERDAGVRTDVAEAAGDEDL